MEKCYRELEDGNLRDKILSTQNMKVHPELFVKFGPTECFLPRSYANHIDTVKNFKVKDDDVWVITYPKSGTTWVQEMVWLIVNDVDYKGAQTPQTVRSPYFEFSAIRPRIDSAKAISITSTIGGSDESKLTTSFTSVEKLKSPRIIKTHLHYNMLPTDITCGLKKPKIIYVARNPKDACVSAYHHRVTFAGYLGTLEDSVEEFIAGLCMYGPYWNHVREFWKRKNESSNILFITYEDMKKDLSYVISRVATFLGKTLSDEENIKLAGYLSFENMKNNPYVNNDEVAKVVCKSRGTELKSKFMRKGKVGSWKEELASKEIALLNKWISKNSIEGLYIPDVLVE